RNRHVYVMLIAAYNYLISKTDAYVESIGGSAKTRIAHWPGLGVGDLLRQLPHGYLPAQAGTPSRARPLAVNADHFPSTDVDLFPVAFNGADDPSRTPVRGLAVELCLIHFVQRRSVAG